MSQLSFLMLLFGFALFGVGAGARTYMNARIRRSKPPNNSPLWWTESEYRRLMASEKAPKWPLVLSLIGMSLGAIIMLTAILVSDKI